MCINLRFGIESRWKNILAAISFIDNVQMNPDLVINRNGKMRKRKRINNWQAEGDEKMKSLDIKRSTQNIL